MAAAHRGTRVEYGDGTEARAGRTTGDAFADRFLMHGGVAAAHLQRRTRRSRRHRSASERWMPNVAVWSRFHPLASPRRVSGMDDALEVMPTSRYGDVVALNVATSNTAGEALTLMTMDEEIPGDSPGVGQHNCMVSVFGAAQRTRARACGLLPRMMFSTRSP